MKIVFMGTPHFAVASLRRIHESNKHQIVGVVTATDKPAGRGQKMMFSAVKEYAVEHNLFLLQPDKLKSADFLETLQRLQADLFVVVAFRMLPEVVWQMPPKGTINLHSSLLPNYRGAAPINWAIINGEKVSGVTTFFIEKEMDKGAVIHQKEAVITDTMNAGELHDILMNSGAELLESTIDEIANGTCTSIDQKNFDRGTLKEAYKIFKETCKINWNESSETVHNLIRGLAPYPSAYSDLQLEADLMTAKILKAVPTEVESVSDCQIGETVTDGKSFLHVKCSTGFISIEEIQLQGKSKVKISDFLNGLRGKKVTFL